MYRAAYLALTVAVTLALAAPAAAASRYFSYDPANDTTRRVAGDLTFEFTQRFVWVKLLSVLSTEGHATAALRPASEGALGPGGLSRVIGVAAHERDLYEVQSADQGGEMIRAFCPGSTHAWMAFGRVAEGVPLRVLVIGDAPDGGGRAHLCQTLEFFFRGEWRVPGRGPPPTSELVQPRLPH
jgi:hypothetical protein